MFKLNFILVFFCLFTWFLVSCSGPKAGTSSDGLESTDSTQVSIRFALMLKTCWDCDPQVNCSKLAPFIVYQGRTSPERAWKDLADYSLEEDRNMVHKFCMTIRKVIPEGTKYRINGFLQERESEGVWNVLSVIPDVPENTDGRSIEFAFLNVNGQYALGDIDTR